MLLYGVSHEKIVTHVKTTCVSAGQHACVDQEQHMCLFHFSHATHHHMRVVRNTDNEQQLPVLDYWKQLPARAAVSDTVFLPAGRRACKPCIADRVILFKQIRI